MQYFLIDFLLVIYQLLKLRYWSPQLLMYCCFPWKSINICLIYKFKEQMYVYIFTFLYPIDKFLHMASYIDCLINVTLCMMSNFYLFPIKSIFVFTFSLFVIICLRVTFGCIFHENIWALWIWLCIFFQKFWKFSAVISLRKVYFGPLYPSLLEPW